MITTLILKLPHKSGGTQCSLNIFCTLKPKIMSAANSDCAKAAIMLAHCFNDGIFCMSRERVQSLQLHSHSY